MTCRICTANDEEALVEQMAEAMWQTQSSTNPDDEWRPWGRPGRTGSGSCGSSQPPH